MSSLEKSHSKSSNFKLSLICLLFALFSTLIWVGVVLVKYVNQTYGYITIGVSAALALFFFILINKFTR